MAISDEGLQLAGAFVDAGCFQQFADAALVFQSCRGFLRQLQGLRMAGLKFQNLGRERQHSLELTFLKQRPAIPE